MKRRRQKRHAGGGSDCGLEGQGMSGAHLKHDVHVCDLGRVEEQRLVER